jgi:hypothetical protein
MANHARGSVKRWRAAIAVVTAIGAGTLTAGLGTASADSDIGVKMKTPYTYIHDLLTWEQQSGKNGVTCTVASNQAVAGDTGTSPEPAGYSTVDLSAADASSVAGNGAQIFSDRRDGGQPFAVGRADVLGLRLALAPDDSPVVTLQFQSWGGVRQTLSNLRIEDGLLVGDGPAVGGYVDAALYTISCATWSL